MRKSLKSPFDGTTDLVSSQLKRKESKKVWDKEGEPDAECHAQALEVERIRAGVHREGNAFTCKGCKAFLSLRALRVLDFASSFKG